MGLGATIHSGSDADAAAEIGQEVLLGIGDIFNTFIMQPMLNILLVLQSVLAGQFWLAIIVFTILVRLVMMPLTLPQQKSAKKMQELQPRLKELQAKYGKDRERMAKEQMALYKEAGANPLGGCLPMLVQFPIWIGLYQSIIHALGHQPLQLLGLSQYIYAPLQSLVWPQVPLNRFFLGMDLSLTPSFIGGVLAYAFPVLVAFTMWLQSKMTITPSADPQSASMNQSMTTMMPLMFGFFSLQFALGLSLYFIVSNVFSIVSQGFISGWEGLAFWKGMSLGGLLGGGRRPAPGQSGSSSSQVTTTRSARQVTGGNTGGTESGVTRKKKRRRKR
jgi:YidC/Oxa1 family membrane protein insertase